MKRLILTAALASIPLLMSVFFLSRPARADGKIFARAETNNNPSTTWQEAVIIHDGATEQLILQVNFEGRGKEFAWIIPTPAVPQVSLERPYIFRVLKSASEPEIKLSGGLQRFKAISYPIAIIIIYLAMLKVQRLSGLKRDMAYFCLGLLLVIVWQFVYFVEMSTFGKGSLGRAESSVVVHEQKDLGIYQTATLSAKAPEDLIKWLRENDYSVPKDSLPVLRHYIDKGWHFTAVKISLGKGQDDFSWGELGKTPTLGLKFPSREIVFPLKITSLAGEDSMVMLYVLAPGFVKADHFKLMYANISPDEALGASLPISDKADHFTRLWAKFSPGKMDDVTLETDPGIDEFQGTFFTREFKTSSLITLVVGMFALIIIWGFRQKLAWKLLFTVPVIVSCYEQYPVFSSTPYDYYETHENLKYPPLGRGAANRVLEEIYARQQKFRDQHGAYAATFKELDYFPEAQGFTFYLTPDEFHPPAPLNPYGFFFDDTTELDVWMVHKNNHSDRTRMRAKEIFSTPKNDFAALAIGSSDDEGPVSFTMINENFSEE